jgi:hypothetical protein
VLEKLTSSTPGSLGSQSLEGIAAKELRAHWVWVVVGKDLAGHERNHDSKIVGGPSRRDWFESEEALALEIESEVLLSKGAKM